jgi:hypothetical protein
MNHFIVNLYERLILHSAKVEILLRLATRFFGFCPV